MIAVIILAAGKSQRMGSVHKLTQDLGGRPLLSYAVDAALGSKAGPVILVEGETQCALPQSGIERIHASDAHKGQSHSLRAGIKAIEARPEVTGVLITLADMPFITSALIDQVYDAACSAPSKIVRPFAGEKPGHPVYWPRSYFAALQTLEGETGAQPILRKAGAGLKRIDIKNDAIIFDVDTPDALERARKRLHAIG